MKEYLKMGDAFPDGVYVCTEEWMAGWFEVRYVDGESIDESCDGGYSERDANYISHAINSHDELVAEVERLRGIIERVISTAHELSERSPTTQWGDGYKECALATGHALEDLLGKGA